MKIISWDVGIIHLAYCIMEFDKDKNTYKIYDWKQINLTNFDENLYKCCKNNKNGEKCNSNGKYFYTENNERKYVCGRHKSKYIPKIITIDEYFKKEKGDVCNYINKEKKCSKKSTYQSEKYCYCTVHAKSFIKRENKSQQLQSIKKVNSMKMSIDILRYNLVTKLEELPQLLNVDKVLIENQPSLKNPKMKAISSTIYDYFLIRGIIDKERTKSNIKYVKYISPSNKLKVDEDNTIKTLSKTSDNKKYKMTKQLGILYCKQLIKNDKNNLDFLDTQKKKDDLCDAFLQGAYYLSKH
jgi:hypothetical protein